MHWVPATHDTDVSVPDVNGVVWIDQLVPSHRATAVPGVPNPTATQTVFDAHETLVSPPPAKPGGVCTFWSVHWLPFQISISGGESMALMYPTATHHVGDGQETEFRTADGPAGAGDIMIDH